MAVFRDSKKVFQLLRSYSFSKLLIPFVIFAIEGNLSAQVSYDSQEDTYSQSFDTLPSTGTTFTWVDNSTIPGWYAANSATTSFNPAGVSTGSTTTGNLYSFGSTSSTDRALGSIGSGTIGNVFWGVKLVNNTGTTITGFTVGYTGEQWRNSAAAAQAMSFQYSLSATDVKTGAYTTVNSLGFTGPISGGTVGAINGNTAANRSVITGAVTDINWLPGQALWVRFSDPDHTGNDHGLAVDDFSFKASGSIGAYDPPSGYYNSAQGLTGDSLQYALHNIIAGQAVIPYTSSTTTDVWAALKVLDEDPNDSTKVKLVYSGTSILKTDSSWDREHLWPQSRGVSGSGPDFSDLFNLRPILQTVNSSRGNKFYDISNTADSGYHSPAYTGAAADTSTDSDSWEPSADERGDIARALFYMDIRYDGTDSSTLDLSLNNVITGNQEMAVLATLLQWSHDDPVSEAERKRNQKIYTDYQHNRNPFVDHPEYVDLIFGDLVNQSEDTDLDGIPNAWESSHGLNPNNRADALADSDGDGFTNYEEYWMGTDPQNAADPVVLHVNGAYTGSVQNGSSAQPFKTIQAAADAVPSNQRRAIWVHPGTYNERPYITGKNDIHFFSTDGAAATIIDGQGGSTSVVRIYDFQRASFVGFTVKGASTNYYGAGLRIDALPGSIMITEDIIKNNTSTNTSSGGGGIYLRTASGSIVANNFIFGNSALRGGGVLFAAGNAKFWHNTVATNTATGGNGGGLSALSGVVPDIRNNIIWGNTGSTAAQIHQIIAANNIIQGAPSGNSGADPLFVSAGTGDYHITTASPAQGTAVPLALPGDFDWQLRSSTVPDIGADEIPTANFVDTDNDGLDDTWEINHFGNLAATAGSDPDGDGLTNLQEYQQGSDPNDYYSQGSTTITPVISIVSGNNQSSPENFFAPQSLVIKVTNGIAGPVLGNAPVTFTVQGGGQSLATIPSLLANRSNTLTLHTDALTGQISNAQTSVYFYIPPAMTGIATVQVTTGSAFPVTFSLTNSTVDSDGDGLPDDWEVAHFSNLNQGAQDNPDNDQWNNLQEYQKGLDPNHYDGVPKFILIYESGQMYVLSEDLKYLHHYAAPAGKMASDPSGGYWLGYVSGGKLALRNYSQWDNYSEFVSTLSVQDVKCIRWANKKILIVYRSGDENYLTTYDPATSTLAAGHKLVSATGSSTYVTTSDWIFGLEQLTPNGKIWVKHAEFTSSFDPNGVHPGYEIDFLDYPQTGYGNGIETIAYSDTQLATIDKNAETSGGQIRIWDPEHLNDPSKTFTYVENMSSTHGFYTALLLLKDGRFLAGSGLANSVVTEVRTDHSIHDVDLGVPLFASGNPGDNDTGNMVEVTDSFGDRNGNGIFDSWEWEHFGDYNQTANGDFDGDGFTNLQEYQQGTNPSLPNGPDSDGDGLVDATEPARGSHVGPKDHPDVKLHFQLTN